MRTPIEILLMLLFLCVAASIHAQSYKEVMYSELFTMAESYAEVITTNEYHELSNFHGELGEDDNNLILLIVGKRDGKYQVLVEQDDSLEKGNLINLYSMNIPDTLSIYVYSSNYSSPLLIYHSPDKRHYKEQCDDYVADPLYIIDVHGTWLKVRFKVSGKTYEGWIPKEEYCSNPYTTCN